MICAANLAAAWSALASAPENPLAWPAAAETARPWSYWWWLGSAVDKENLTRELTRYRDAGWGGVHIIPIYGAKGWEPQFIDYLSPDWMEMLRHTVSEAHRLGLEVDMTTGTGWCFGGPNVPPQQACAQVVGKSFPLAAGEAFPEKLDRAQTQAVMAFSADGQCLDLLGKVGEDGRLNWTPDRGSWQIWTVSQKPTSRVKRAAPGGQGFMLNPLSADAVRHWLERFSSAFDKYDGPKPRAQYHDSFEYQVNWSPDLFAQFEKRRGYRLQQELPLLLGKVENDRAARVKSDYRETISDLMIESSMPLWFGWCRDHGFLTRNQAHGSPANLLDLYAMADIPETEMFNKDRRPLVAKFASSAAHVSGKNIVASESGTWLREHFTETLADVQGLLDDLFISGVNHVIFHGTCYSPDQVDWPGWVFYASTEMNPRNPIWRDVPALAAYIARCQSVLQAGLPDNDILVYWPISDVWHDAKGLAQSLSVHGAEWFTTQPIGSLAERLWNGGFTFDYVSDRQLAGMSAAGRVLVVPATEHMPLATVEQLLRLAEGGAKVIFDGSLPRDVPGLLNLDARRETLRTLASRLGRVATVGKAEAMLTQARVARESMADHPGLRCIRRKLGDGRYYFLANRGEQAVDGWVPLATPAKAVAILEPMSGRAGLAEFRDGSSVRLQLAPGESVILRTFTETKPEAPRWEYGQAQGQSVAISGTWDVKFLEGGPELPQPVQTSGLGSWTGFGGELLQRFAGTARYSIKFNAPKSGSADWWLDLGRVCQSARVRLNGRDLGTVFKPPFRVVAEGLREDGNLLEVEVTSVAANRIRDLDRRGVKWHNFYDIGLVNMDYKPFDASGWPLADCGLLGPVTLVARAK